MNDTVIDLRDPDAQVRIEARNWTALENDTTDIYRTALLLIAEVGGEYERAIAQHALTGGR